MRARKLIFQTKPRQNQAPAHFACRNIPSPGAQSFQGETTVKPMTELCGAQKCHAENRLRNPESAHIKKIEDQYF
jgi:hypothetical protein